jgi:hypothetical protein
MNSRKFAIALGGACFAASAAVAAPPALLAGPVTVANGNNGEAQFSLAQDAQPQGCQNTFYDSGDALQFGTGRTVGTSSGWEVYQPFMVTTDYTLCAIATDGWYVTGSPATFRGSIFPDAAGTPDIANPLTGADFQLSGDAQNPHFVTMPCDPVCLRADTLYYFGARATGDHWSAIFRDTVNGGSLMPSFSIQGGNFGTRYSAPPICLKLFGDEGCGGGCPSDFAARVGGTCPSSNSMSWSGAPASSSVRVLYTTNGGGGGTIPPNSPCPGTTLCIGLGGVTLHPQVLHSDASGAGSVNSFSAPCGLHLQLITQNSCKTSNAMTL